MKGFGNTKFIALIMLFVCYTAIAEQDMYCVEDDAVGFRQEHGELKRAYFSPQRFTVKIIDDFDSVIIGAFTYQCSVPHPKTARSAFKLCNHSYGSSFRFFASNKRFIFIRSSSFGYLYGEDDDGISAGTCETF